MTSATMSDVINAGGRRRCRPWSTWVGLRWLAVCLLCGGTASVTAEPASPRFTHLSVRDGLSQSSVSHILQDRRGFLWFGTQEGLNRYDGYRFTVHRAKDQPGFLGDHEITALIEDHLGDLWVGTSRGLYRHDLATGRFDRQAEAEAPVGIRKLVESRDGRIFFATWDGGLWVLDPRGGDRSARAVRSAVFPPGTRITALAPGGGSSIWAAGSGRLFHVEAAEPGAAARITEALGDLGNISVISTDSRGDVWIGRQEADLLRYRPPQGQVDRWPQAPRNPLAIVPATARRLWIGARGGGVSRLDPTTGEIAVYRHDPEDPTSLSRDDVPSVYEDHVGSLWAGTWNGGVNRLDPYAQAMHTLRHRPQIADSLPADDVTALGEAPDGRLWVVSRGGLVAVGDPRSGRFRVAATLPARSRLTALELSGPRVLVGTSDGLVAIDPGSGRTVALDPPLRAARLDTRPINVIRTARGVSFIASGKDVFRVRRDPGLAAGLRVERLEPQTEGEVSALAAFASGGLGIGSEAGEVVLAAPNPGAGVTYRKIANGDGSLAAHGLITALHEDPQGRLWVGTRRGLGRIEPTTGKTSWLGETDGLPSTTIAGITGDTSNLLWVATNRGLTRLDPRDGAMTHFAEREGAQEKGYADGAWAAGRSGLLYFAGEGITVFDPKDLRSSPHRPGIVFTGLEILRRPVAPRWLDQGSPLERAIDSQAELTLGPSDTVFSVEMAPLEYGDPASNRLAYRLEGFDPEWIETGAQNRVATYTRLEPGRYVLHARARTKSGLWSEKEATLAIRILPPWWRTRTALVGWSLLAALAAGLGWAEAGRRTRVRFALRERETLRRESLTDPLTGLYNRRFLTSYLHHEVPKLLREYDAAGPAAPSVPGLLLLLIDVDHFKKVNDDHTHAAGDRVLAAIAAVLRDHIRDSDLAVRWGGDEFLVVSRSFHLEHAAASVERLRAEVEALGLRLAKEGLPACTLSIGYAPFPFLVEEPNALTWEQTLDLADRALFLTKRRQRNSYTGLRARPGLTSAALIEALAAGSGTPLPAEVEVVVHGLAA